MKSVFLETLGRLYIMIKWYCIFHLFSASLSLTVMITMTNVLFHYQESMIQVTKKWWMKKIGGNIGHWHGSSFFPIVYNKRQGLRWLLFRNVTVYVRTQIPPRRSSNLRWFVNHTAAQKFLWRIHSSNMMSCVLSLPLLIYFLNMHSTWKWKPAIGFLFSQISHLVSCYSLSLGNHQLIISII